MILCLPSLSVPPLLKKNLPCALPAPISSRRQVFTVFRILYKRITGTVTAPDNPAWLELAGTISMEIHFPSRVRSTYYGFGVTKASTNVYRVLDSISRRTIGFRFHRNTAGRRSWELAEVTKSSFLRSLRLNSLCSVVGRASAAKKAAEKCFRTNWRAVIAVRARNRFHGIVDLAAQRPFGKLAVRAMKSATTPPGDNADKKTAGLAREKESRS